MQGHKPEQDLSGLESDLTQIYREMHERGLSLEETVERASKAKGLYEKFRKGVANETFDVLQMRPKAEGRWEEESFDWACIGGKPDAPPR